MDTGAKNVVLWAVIIMAALLLWQVVGTNPRDQKTPEIDYSRFMSEVDAGAVVRVDIAGTRIRGTYRDGKGQFQLIGPNNPAVYLDMLRSKGVEIHFRDAGFGAHFLGPWGPLIFIGVVWFLMILRIRRKGWIPPGGGPPPAGNSGLPIEPR